MFTFRHTMSFALSGPILLWLIAFSRLEVATAHEFKVVHSFCENGCADGARPNGLIEDQSGNLYGTTSSGGANRGGVVFELSPTTKGRYKLSVLYSFCAQQQCTDGGNPVGSLIIDTAGALYGATNWGGALGQGVVFKLTPGSGQWSLQVLHQFCNFGPNCGMYLQAGLAYAGATSGAPYDGKSPLFGTTEYGGPHKQGIVYEIQPGDPQWIYQTVYVFCQLPECSDGAASTAPLVVDNSGNLYGTTAGGGEQGDGVAFELSPANGGWSETVLHSFCSQEDCEDGEIPLSGSTMDARGNLIGATALGGSRSCETAGAGVIYKLAPEGSKSKEVVIHDFCAHQNYGGGTNPVGTPTLDSNGNVFDTTETGGTSNGGITGGVVFELAGGRYRVLYRFCSKLNCEDGADPQSGVIRDPSGALFGTTILGGTKEQGTVFEILP